MSDIIGSNDPLDPVYQQDPGKLHFVKRIGSLGAKTNLAVLIIIAAILMIILAVVGTEREAVVLPEPPVTVGE